MGDAVDNTDACIESGYMLMWQVNAEITCLRGSFRRHLFGIRAAAASAEQGQHVWPEWPPCRRGPYFSLTTAWVPDPRIRYGGGGLTTTCPVPTYVPTPLGHLPVLARFTCMPSLLLESHQKRRISRKRLRIFYGDPTCPLHDCLFMNSGRTRVLYRRRVSVEDVDLTCPARIQHYASTCRLLHGCQKSSKRQDGAA